MIRATATYLASIPAVFIDGLLFAMIAWLVFSQSYMGGDEAAKYVTPMVKFWINYVIGSLAAIAGSVKMFRSTSYAAHQKDKKEGTAPPFHV